MQLFLSMTFFSIGENDKLGQGILDLQAYLNPRNFKTTYIIIYSLSTNIWKYN